MNVEGRILHPVLTIGAGNNPDMPQLDAAGPLRLPAPASSLVVYEVVLPAE